jgi:hypothetical protein
LKKVEGCGMPDDPPLANSSRGAKPVFAPTEAELRLVEAAASGTIATFKDETIRSELIEILCCGSRSDWPVSPDGVRLSGGTIVGQLGLANRDLAGPLWLQDANIFQGIRLANARTKTVDFSKSRIGGALPPPDVEASIALEADRVHVDGDLILDGAQVTGACQLERATITGQFVARGARFENSAAAAISAKNCNCAGFFLDNATVIGTCDIAGAMIDGSFFLDGATVSGVFDLHGATVKGQFAAEGATFDYPRGIAIRASTAHIGSWFMRPRKDENKNGQPTSVHGTINLVRAHIAHDLDFQNVQLKAGHHLAISAREIVVEGSVYLWRGSKVDGGIRFRGAEIKGQLSLTDSSISSAMLARKRSADPLPPLPADADDSDTALWTSLALDLSEARVGHLTMPDRLDNRPQGIIDLSRARIGTFTDFKAAWPPKVDRKTRACVERPCDENGRDADHLVLDGFEYEHLDNPDGLPFGETGAVAEARRDWLLGQSRDDVFERLKPQPWRQLGKILAKQGYEDDARKISIQRRLSQRHAKGMWLGPRALNRALHWLADYGFNPWKTIGWSAGVVVVFSLLYWGVAAKYSDPKQPLAFNQRVFVQTLAADFVPGIQSNSEANVQLLQVYPRFDPLMYSLDVFLPLVDLGIEKYWRVNTGTWLGVGLYYLSILEGIIGAILLLLIVTGFTGLLTRDEKSE